MKLPREVFFAEFTFMQRRWLTQVQQECYEEPHCILSIREFIPIGPREILFIAYIAMVNKELTTVWDLDDCQLPDRRGKSAQLVPLQAQRLSQAALRALRERGNRATLWEEGGLSAPDAPGLAFRRIDGLDASRPLQQAQPKVLEASRPARRTLTKKAA